jgi:hypothetical protein
MSQFTGLSKAYASSLVSEFINMRYDGSGVRAYIQKMTSTVAKLNKYLGKDLAEDFVVHVIMRSLPQEFDTFHVHYNSAISDNWNLDQMMVQCIQEEEKLKNQLGDSSFAHHQAKKKNKFSKQNFKKPGTPRVSSSRPPQRPKNHGKMKIFPVDIDTCMYCKEKWHYKKNCPEFLKYLLKNSNVQVTFIDEPLFLEFSTSTWWIDSGMTIHVVNSLQGLSIRRELAKGQRSIIVVNGVEIEVKAIGDLAIELDDGFVLNLNNILFVPSLRRNIISVSCLDDENIHCHFGDGNCIMKYDVIDGIAI